MRCSRQAAARSVVPAQPAGAGDAVQFVVDGPPLSDKGMVILPHLPQPHRVVGSGGFHDGEARTAACFTPEVQREYATVLAILLTGRMDHQLVEMPGPDGRPGFAVVGASAANDPARLQEIRESLHCWAGERQAVDEELDGIARASGLSTDG